MNCAQKCRIAIGGLLAIGLLTFAGCQPPASSRQPPSPVALTVAEGNGYLVFYRWEGGPAVMICSDVKPDITRGGENAAGPPWRRTNTGLVGSHDGAQVEWQFDTTDNRTVKAKIYGTERDLAAGNVFLVKTQGGMTVVEQVQRDLSAVKPDAESVKAFAAGDEGMRRLLGTAGK